jgi:hypothetical protein
MDDNKMVNDLIGNMRNLEISLLAVGSRLALVESFNSQLAQGQIDMKEVLKKLMKDSQQPQDQSNLNQVVLDLVKTVEQLKATQNILMIRLKSSS